MSITKIRKGLPAGCGLFFGIIFIIVLVVGLIPNSPFNKGNQSEGEAQLGSIAFKVNDQPVYDGPIKTLIQQGETNLLQQKQSTGQPVELNPYDYLEIRMQAFRRATESAVVTKVAESKGIKVSTEDIEPFMAGLAEEQIKQIEQNVQMMSGLKTVQLDTLKKQLADLKAAKKENSPEYKKIQQSISDVEKETPESMFLTYSQGMTKDQIRELYQKQTEEIISQPALAYAALGDVARGKLIEKLKSEIDVSEAAIKASYQKFTFDRIDFQSSQNKDARAKAEDVYKKIKNGMDFKAAQLQFTDTKPVPTTAETLQMLDLNSMGLESIASVKAGQVSEPIETDYGFTIVRVTKIEPNVPNDFAKQMPGRIEQMRNQLSFSNSSKLLKEATKSAKFEYIDLGWKLLKQYEELKTGELSVSLSGAANQEKRIQAWKDLVTECENAPEADDQMRVLVRYAAFTQLETEMKPGTEKEKLAEQRLQVYSDAAQYVESTNFRFELVNTLLDAKKGDEALDRLLEIAMASQEPTAANKTTIGKIENLLPKAANLASKDSPLIQQIQEEIKRWREAEAEQKKQEAEMKKQEEEAKKAEAAEKAKQDQPKKPGN